MTLDELVLVVASALLHGAWNVVAKRSANPVAFLFLVTVVTTAVSLPLWPWLPWRVLTPEVMGLVAASGLVHGLTFTALGLAYLRGNLSLVYPISRSTPALVPLLAYLSIGERVSWDGGLGIALTVAGLWLVHTGGSLRWGALAEPAAGYAYLVLLLGAAYSVIDKRAMLALSSLPWPSPVSRAVAFYLFFTAGAALVFGPVAWRTVGGRQLVRAARREPGMLAGSAAATLASYVLILEALRTAPVSYVVTVRQLSVVFVLLASVHTLRERPTPLRVGGVLATIGGVGLVAFGR